MKRRFLLALATLVVSGFWLTAYADVQKELPLPYLSAVFPTNASIPQKLSRFSGKWCGMWDDVMRHILIVQEIVGPTEVHVIYAWGAYEEYGSDTPGWSLITGEFKGDELYLELTRAVATYEYNEYDKGSLEATYYITSSGNSSYATLTKEKCLTP